MSNFGKWELSNETEDRLNKICLKLECENPLSISKNWLLLFNYGTSTFKNHKMEVADCDVNPKVDDISNIVKESLASDVNISEAVFVGISINNLSRIFMSVNTSLDELAFCSFCKNIATWEQDILIEQSLRLIVLPKLKEITEATGCIIFSVKKIAAKQPFKFCENVLIPLLSDDTFKFTDAELLSGVFSVLPTAQKDLLILTFSKKKEFFEEDWLLLNPLLKDLSQNNFLHLLECIEKFSAKFVKSQIFGRFLVNFCKSSDFTVSSRQVLKEVLKKHETLLRIQALKHLESS